ncbi:hypothetical protein L6164_029991 [Bauhinia variegata]|uniref:Uncharacterized protein n=1 Tax=Bauhinia variegata TaxID=167791 RepID=A0ACB9LB04_BAUVA|nr:hypothetical protein L6164_029991 [Bauhinia variegata]
MVYSLPKLISFLLFFLGLASAKCHTFSRTISPSVLGLDQQELNHLNFYFHDIISGQNPTAVRVAEAPITNTSPTHFGAVMMADGPLTAEPELSSKIVGSAQGIYGSASQSELSFLMVLNFAFTEGEYNGSSLSVLGRNPLSSTVREMPIVGGSGLFRFARGYAEARTHAIDFKTGNAIEEFNVYVFHY